MTVMTEANETAPRPRRPRRVVRARLYLANLVETLFSFLLRQP